MNKYNSATIYKEMMTDDLSSLIKELEDKYGMELTIYRPLKVDGGNNESY